MAPDDHAHVTPAGGSIRRRRHEHGWSRRALLGAIARAGERESGLPAALSLNLLAWIEESNEPVPYATLCQIAAGLDCDPVELLHEAE